MRPVRGKRIVAILAAGGLTLAAAACGDAPEDTPSAGGSASAAAAFKACMVTDTGGIDDKSFNASAWAGMQAAKNEASNVDAKYVSSSSEADYEPGLRSFVTQKCNFILAVGGLMGTVTKKVSDESKNAQFGIVDSSSTGSNVYPMQFATEQAAFLAGYLAAGYSKSGTVGTYGGMKIAPVTVFMDGFADGVAYYNQKKGKTVKVLGWDKAKQNGTFAESFIDQNKGKTITQTLVSQGADVILPVAGGTGLGTAQVAKDSAGKVAVIWVDQDGCKSAAQYCDVFLSTVVKNVQEAVKEAVLKGAKGEALAATPGYLGTLENNGIELAEYHSFDSKIDAALKGEVEQLKQDIIAGTVKVQSANAPK
ncbi:BMP family lipoprotein [Actinoplanes teichomyceticus]|uniref:Nucleoside-binding protein n=1 Tax=Actinoplanes teichomyceticus TaxID=1867 RepID=A0A561WPQ0_ACTTI|nr:BMP family ABC transporter substrate-binding protein [Actinoplanes teichomyceticus]TWG25840.1 nucleoside-binding protein [Actinoplanes teichomyceticus]GIF10916.1 BMP family ABC transporter substrate-binding protein [Actinoplanes teichomyceticus]